MWEPGKSSVEIKNSVKRKGNPLTAAPLVNQKLRKEVFKDAYCILLQENNKFLTLRKAEKVPSSVRNSESA